MSNIEQIWPRIGTEIKRARRIRAAQRTATGICISGLLSAGVFVLSQHLSRKNDPADMDSGWNLPHVAVSQAIAASYPLAHDSKLFVLRREKPADNIIGSDKLWHVACLDGRSGKVIWKSGIKVASARMAMGSGRLFLLYTRNRRTWRCAALSEKDGSLLWQHETRNSGWPGPSTPLTVEDKIYWVSGRTVICRDATAGTLQWSTTIDTTSRLSAPARCNGKVLTAGGDNFHVLTADNGEVERTASLSGNKTGNGRIRGAFTVRESGNRIYMGWNGSYGGYIQCRTIDMTEVLWQKKLPDFLKMELTDGYLFARGMDIRAYNSLTGALKWKAPVGGCGSLAVDNGQIYAVDAAELRALVALDNRTGNEVWRHKVGSSCNGIVVSGHMGFVNNNEGILQALPLTHNRKGRNRG